LLETDTGVEYGATPSFNKEDPNHMPENGAVYTFIGWKIDGGGDTVYNVSATTDVSAFLPVVGNTVFIAAFTDEHVWIVSWQNEGNILERDTVYTEREQSSATFDGEEPKKLWFDFIGWSVTPNNPNPEITNNTVTDVNNHKTLYACFSPTTPELVSLPTARSGLRYNGYNQFLLNSNEVVVNGEIEYSLGTEDTAGNNWQTSIPMGKDVTTYFVWCRVHGASITDPEKVIAAIAPKIINADEVTIAKVAEQPYKGKEVNPQPIVTDADGVIVTGTWKWENNNAVGMATGVFYADGNFTVVGAVDEIQTKFTIVEDTSFSSKILKIAFVVVCVVGIISIICVAVVCTRKRIAKADNSII
jgi:hypothetical protein